MARDLTADVGLADAGCAMPRYVFDVQDEEGLHEPIHLEMSDAREARHHAVEIAQQHLGKFQTQDSDGTTVAVNAHDSAGAAVAAVRLVLSIEGGR